MFIIKSLAVALLLGFITARALLGYGTGPVVDKEAVAQHKLEMQREFEAYCNDPAYKNPCK